MQVRPNEYWHMMNWGLLAGTILGSLFIAFISGFDMTTPEMLGIVISPVLWLAGLILGGVPGVILGFFEGVFIRQQLKSINMPSMASAIKDKRWSVYAIAFSVPFVAHLMITTAIFMLGDPQTAFFYGLIFSIQTIIASIASVYAAHRYLYRLRLFTMQHTKSKTKGKRQLKQDTSHLEDEDEWGLNWLDEELTDDLQDHRESSR